MKDSTWIAATAAMMSSCVFGAADAHAGDETHAKKEAQPEAAPIAAEEDSAHPPDWLLGVGVGIDLGLGGLAGAAGTGSAGLIGGYPMLYGAGVERRLTPSLWIFGDLGGSFASYEGDGEYPVSQSSYSLDGRLGLRPVVNPEDRIQLSLLASLGASLNRLEADATIIDEGGAVATETSRSRAWSIHAEAGVAVDFWITRAIALRLDTGLLRVAHQRYSMGGATTSSWVAELGLSPSVGFLVGF